MLENVQTECVPDLGRVLVATRDIEPGKIVLKEDPCLTWGANQSQELIVQFMSAPESVKERILCMASPPLDADLCHVDDPELLRETTEARQQRASMHSAVAKHLSEALGGGGTLATLIERLLLIDDINAHMLITYAPGSHEPCEQAALFDVASKATHSCDPNCGHTTVKGQMLYYAVREIRRGERITISYIDYIWSTCREDRRRLLLQDKRFFCRCSRCMGIDDCRGLRCSRAQCGNSSGNGNGNGIVNGSPRGVAYRSSSCGSAPWRCYLCKGEHRDAEMHKELAVEQHIRERAAQVQHDVSHGRCVDQAPLLDVISDVCERLSPTHYLGVMLLDELRHSFPQSTTRPAAWQLVILEAVAAGCSTFTSVSDFASLQLPSSAHLLAEATFAFYECQRIGAESSAAAIASRYLGWAQLQYGTRQASVQDMERAVAKWPPGQAPKLDLPPLLG